MESFFRDLKFIGINQLKEWVEIAIDWETGNKYELVDENGEKIGFASERKTGIFGHLVRNFLKSHRPMHLDVWDKNKILLLSGRRPFYFFFSDIEVSDSQGRKIGDVKTRFGILKRKYDLLDSYGNVFASIESFRWKIWSFSILDKLGNEVGKLGKKWGGLLKEVFTDSDSFGLDLSKSDWSSEQKAVIFYAALSIDLDFFEENSSSAFSLFD